MHTPTLSLGYVASLDKAADQLKEIGRQLHITLAKTSLPLCPSARQSRAAVQIFPLKYRCDAIVSQCICGYCVLKLVCLIPMIMSVLVHICPQ